MRVIVTEKDAKRNISICNRHEDVRGSSNKGKTVLPALRLIVLILAVMGIAALSF